MTSAKKKFKKVRESNLLKRGRARELCTGIGYLYGEFDPGSE